MTCGIYKLNFTGTKQTYIGQSTNIEKRYRQHTLSMEQGKANKKLQEAYSMYGYPTIDVIIEASIEELDALEDECIDVWDSVNNGFNIYYSANEAPSYFGYGGGNTKYPKYKIVQAFELLADTDDTYTDIGIKVQLPTATVSNISLGINHIWLKEEYPDRYILLTSKAGKRKNYAVVSEKLSAKSKGIEYPLIKDPLGTVYKIDNAYKFAKEHGLAPNHFQEVLNRHRKSHKGWKLCPDEQVY